MLHLDPRELSTGIQPVAPLRGEGPQAFAMRDLLNSMFYHRKAAMIVACVVISLGLVVAVVMPPSYSAVAQLLPLSTGIYDSRETNGPPQPGQALDPTSVSNVELQILNSLDLHRNLVRAQLGAGANPAAVNKALERFESHLHTTKINDTNVLELTYTDRDPQVAATVLRRLIDAYFTARANALTAGRVAYLEGQRDRVKRQLDAADAQLTAFQQAHGIANIAAQIDGAVRENDTLRQNEADAAVALADTRTSGEAIRRALGKTPSQVELYSDNTEAARALGDMHTQLLTLEAKRADVAARYMSTSPQVQQLDAQIASLKASINEQQSALAVTHRLGRNQVYDNASDRLLQSESAASGASARRGAIASQLTASEMRLRDLNTTAEQLSSLRMDRDVLADNYKSLALQVAQVQVQLNQDSTTGNPSVRVIEAPTTPDKRNNPPMLIIAGSVFAALLLSGATVFVLASLRDVFLVPAELEKAIGLPVLAAPLDGPGRNHAASGFGRLHAAMTAQSGMMRAGRGGNAILLVTDDSFNALQTAAIGLGRDISRRRPGRVLLARFAHHGWSGEDLQSMPLQYIEGMAVTTLSLAATAAGGSEARMIAALKQHYDTIILVAPPMREDISALHLAQVVDFVSVVVVAEKTRRLALTNLLRDLDHLGARLLGLVMLGRRSHIPKAIYRLVA
jgi:uncharacterized protein involved in exopolysaccharide biosynthesis